MHVLVATAHVGRGGVDVPTLEPAAHGIAVGLDKLVSIHAQVVGKGEWRYKGQRAGESSKRSHLGLLIHQWWDDGREKSGPGSPPQVVRQVLTPSRV